jgi:hypothetical protein
MTNDIQNETAMAKINRALVAVATLRELESDGGFTEKFSDEVFTLVEAAYATPRATTEEHVAYAKLVIAYDHEDIGPVAIAALEGVLALHPNM